jgi:hypothetical protein
MNILIEDTTTIEYFTALGNWTKVPLGVKVFPATVAAFRTAKQLAIGKFNIVGHIPGTNQFVNLSHGLGKGPLDSGAELVEPAK